MKIPGPDHPISIEPNQNRVRVTMGGTVLADSTRALTLREASLPPVHYLPREDAQMARFERTERVTHCPYKGDASYYTLRTEDRRAENAVWSYEAPFPAVAAIAGHLAFYPDHVEIIELPARAEPPPQA
ncbi:DUF427 domain-containing protein [Roseomonas sp. KE2513]|uniref:DUF427 domain-containing protein n=1 Tax=Roseomonas sp. KE2513 TaxID=2479202 RepID=UPI0018DF1800|nr:DUF427 domain-containing protein [Roseomonas sp. KE2513]MBI0537922.1 DUF427 domain-containing protein [Roseomonas sp. KE2513]